MFETETSSSAFKPYNKPTIVDVQSENSNLSSASLIDEPRECSDYKVEAKCENNKSPSQLSSSSLKHDQSQVYTIDKLLDPNTSSKKASSSSTCSSVNLSNVPLNLSKTLFPFDLIAQHFWWQQQRHHPQQLSSELTVPSSSQSSAIYPPPHLRRYFLPPQHNRQPRGPRRQRTTFTHEQTLRLEMEYHVSEYISRGKRFQLADLLDLTENQIKIWFQNRRAKDKRIEKAIVEQQYRYLSSSTIPQQINLTNCTTCNYTKQQFETSNGSNS